MKGFTRLLVTAMLFATVGLFGCADDGSDGAPGAPGAEGPAGPVTLTAETCAICHTTGKIADISVAHPVLLEKAVATVDGVSVAADTSIDVAFHVETAAGVPVTDLLIGDIRIYISDIVPAGTVSATGFVDTVAPITTFQTAQLERWAYERSTTVGATLDATDAVNGNYVFNLVSTTADTTLAPDADLATHNQRVLVRVAGDDVTYNDTIALADFLMPATGATTAPLAALSRSIVDMSACVACHNDPLQNAAHGGGYQAPDACVVCHTPLGDEYGDEMQNDGAWLASLIHKIHAAIDMPAFPTRINGGGYSNVTYPKAINDCEVCHADNGQAQASAWNTNPTAEVCTTCHTDSILSVNATTGGGEITHSAAAVSQGAPATVRGNATCALCHDAATIVGYHDPTITTVYDAAITLSGDTNLNGFYDAGEAPLVTVTVANSDGSGATGDYLADFTAASLYVYGPRSLALPVLTPGSTTDQAYIDAVALDPTVLPTQSHSMLATAAATDANVLTDATGFKYQLQAIPADLAPGTYMVQVAIGHASSRVAGSRNYKIDGWQLVTFQVGTVTEEPKVAGDGCQSCHTQEDWGTMYHRSYFGTDGCIACHDKSGNHADFLSNRVHAVHAATVAGDLLDADWSAITFPQDITTCTACHTAGDQYRTEPTIWSAACIGCHGDTPLVEDHMIQNGATVFGAAH